MTERNISVRVSIGMWDSEQMRMEIVDGEGGMVGLRSVMEWGLLGVGPELAAELKKNVRASCRLDRVNMSYSGIRVTAADVIVKMKERVGLGVPISVVGIVPIWGEGLISAITREIDEESVAAIGGIEREIRRRFLSSGFRSEDVLIEWGEVFRYLGDRSKVVVVAVRRGMLDNWGDWRKCLQVEESGLREGVELVRSGDYSNRMTSSRIPIMTREIMERWDTLSGEELLSLYVLKGMGVPIREKRRGRALSQSIVKKQNITEGMERIGRIAEINMGVEWGQGGYAGFVRELAGKVNVENLLWVIAAKALVYLKENRGKRTGARVLVGLKAGDIAIVEESAYRPIKDCGYERTVGGTKLVDMLYDVSGRMTKEEEDWKILGVGDEVWVWGCMVAGMTIRQVEELWWRWGWNLSEDLISKVRMATEGCRKLLSGEEVVGVHDLVNIGIRSRCDMKINEEGIVEGKMGGYKAVGGEEEGSEVWMGPVSVDVVREEYREETGDVQVATVPAEDGMDEDEVRPLWDQAVADRVGRWLGLVRIVARMRCGWKLWGSLCNRDRIRMMLTVMREGEYSSVALYEIGDEDIAKQRALEEKVINWMMYRVGSRGWMGMSRRYVGRVIRGLPENSEEMEIFMGTRPGMNVGGMTEERWMERGWGVRCVGKIDGRYEKSFNGSCVSPGVIRGGVPGEEGSIVSVATMRVAEGYPVGCWGRMGGGVDMIEMGGWIGLGSIHNKLRETLGIRWIRWGALGARKDVRCGGWIALYSAGISTVVVPDWEWEDMRWLLERGVGLLPQPIYARKEQYAACRVNGWGGLNGVPPNSVCPGGMAIPGEGMCILAECMAWVKNRGLAATEGTSSGWGGVWFEKGFVNKIVGDIRREGERRKEVWAQEVLVGRVMKKNHEVGTRMERIVGKDRVLYRVVPDYRRREDKKAEGVVGWGWESGMEEVDRLIEGEECGSRRWMETAVGILCRVPSVGRNPLCDGKGFVFNSVKVSKEGFPYVVRGADGGKCRLFYAVYEDVADATRETLVSKNGIRGVMRAGDYNEIVPRPSDVPKIRKVTQHGWPRVLWTAKKVYEPRL